MTAVHSGAAEAGPIVIFRSVNRDGATFALDRRSLARLREKFGDAVHSRTRLFVSHETEADLEAVHGSIAGQVVLMLTGLSEERLAEIGGVRFRDPVTEVDLPRS